MIAPTLTRKADGANLGSECVISKTSDWYPNFNMPVIPTVLNVPYVQPVGVMYKAADVTLLYGDGVVDNGIGVYFRLIAAARSKALCSYTDRRGDTYDVEIQQAAKPEQIEGLITTSKFTVTVMLRRIELYR